MVLAGGHFILRNPGSQLSKRAMRKSQIGPLIVIYLRQRPPIRPERLDPVRLNASAAAYLLSHCATGANFRGLDNRGRAQRVSRHVAIGIPSKPAHSHNNRHFCHRARRDRCVAQRLERRRYDHSSHLPRAFAGGVERTNRRRCKAPSLCERSKGPRKTAAAAVERMHLLIERHTEIRLITSLLAETATSGTACRRGSFLAVG